MGVNYLNFIFLRVIYVSNNSTHVNRSFLVVNHTKNAVDQKVDAFYWSTLFIFK